MNKHKFELDEQVKIRTSYGAKAIIIGVGTMKHLEGGECNLYLVFFEGEKRGYFTEYELEKK